MSSKHTKPNGTRRRDWPAVVAACEDLIAFAQSCHEALQHYGEHDPAVAVPPQVMRLRPR